MDKQQDEELIQALTTEVDTLKERAKSRAEELEQDARALRDEAERLESQARAKCQEATELTDRARQVREAVTPPPPEPQACHDQFHGAIEGTHQPGSRHITRESCGCWRCSSCRRSGYCSAHDYF